MRIELAYSNAKVVLAAVDEHSHIVARGEGARLDEAVKKLVSRFAELQQQTIEALSASGIIHRVDGQVLS